MSALWNLLVADTDVQVALTGHDHDYERFARMGTSGPDDAGLRQFVVGTGGRSHYCANRERAGQEVFDCSSFGVLELVLLPDGSYDWQFLPATGSFTDSGSEPRR